MKRIMNRQAGLEGLQGLRALRVSFNHSSSRAHRLCGLWYLNRRDYYSNSYIAGDYQCMKKPKCKYLTT